MTRPLSLIAGALLLASTSVVALADLPGADWIKPDELTQKLEAAGYSNVTDSRPMMVTWEGKAVKNGKIVEFKADPRTGAVVKEEIDD